MYYVRVYTSITLWLHTFYPLLGQFGKKYSI